MQNVQHGLTLWKKNGVRYFVVPSFVAAGGVLCAISTRVGGVSKPPFHTLNFSRKREQNEKNYRENMARFSNAAGFNYHNAVANNYAHSAILHRSVHADAGSGVVKAPLKDACDGLYTDEAGLPLVTYHADCAPLIFYDPKRRSVAICHAGWRGIVSHMAKNAIAALCGIGSSAQDILAAVGPCISVRHFEVGSEVAEQFYREFGDETIEKRDGSLYVDLPGACVLDMTNSGIVPSNITVSDICTYETDRLFFSHRRDNGKTGAFAAVIELQVY
jgi:YfiH family protein